MAPPGPGRADRALLGQQRSGSYQVTVAPARRAAHPPVGPGGRFGRKTRSRGQLLPEPRRARRQDAPSVAEPWPQIAGVPERSQTRPHPHHFEKVLLPLPDRETRPCRVRDRPGPWDPRRGSGVLVTPSSAVSQAGRPPGTARAARSQRRSAGSDVRAPRRRLAGRHTTRRRADRRVAGFAVPEPPGLPGQPG
jgi:hypothetical protein